MAIAPVNKFISIMVPVAPGEQKVYEVPTGASALVLYAQVANVGVGTFPTVTLTQRRESRSTTLTRDIRVIKDIEIPPNDAAILIDGRMVLEKTPLVVDRLLIQGTQSGVNTITDVQYCEPLGIVTVTTIDGHGFSSGDQITMGGIAFTCANNNSGITTTIFPDPQASYIVDVVADSKIFTTNVGSANGITHFYNAAIHSFVRANNKAVLANNTTYYTPSGGSYDPKTGVLSLKIVAHGLFSGATSKTPNGAEYNAAVGILTVTTSSAHGYSVTDVIKFDDNALTFSCSMGSGNKTYPRSTDPASGRWKKIREIESTTKFNIDVGKSPIVNFQPTAADYNTTAGILTATIGTHSLLANTSVKLKNGGITFITPNNPSSTFPQSGDPSFNTPINITAVSDTTISLDVGSSQYSGIHTFSSAVADAVISGGDYAHTFVSAVPSSMKKAEDYVGIATGSIIFTCTQDGNATEHGYPRVGDPAYNTNLNIIEADVDNIKVDVGISTAGGLVAPLQMEFLASVLENSNA